MQFRIGKAIGFAIVIWLTGFIWGSIVLMTPSLKSVRPIPYVSSNPAISFPILVFSIFLVYVLARRFITGAEHKAAQGLKLGLTFLVVNFALDLLGIVFLLRTGFGYFAWLTVWIVYGLLLVLPWVAGRAHDKPKARG